jgi:hypothetical protein
VRLWQDWNDHDAQTIAADNLFVDRSADERRKEIQKLKAEFGQCRPDWDLHPETLLRGKFRLSCDQGFVEVYFTLAPTMPPKLQSLTFQPVHQLSAGLKAAAETLAAQFEARSDERLRPVLAAPLDVAALGHQIDSMRPLYGSCRLGETTIGDGRTFAGVRLTCERGAVQLGLRADEQGNITNVNFSRPAESACIQ